MSTLNCWMCRHPNVSQSTNKLHVESIIGEDLTLECPICYEAFESSSLFFTECKHYACVKCTDSMFKKNLDNNLRPENLRQLRPENLRQLRPISRIGYFQVREYEFTHQNRANLEALYVEFTGRNSVNYNNIININ